MENIFIPNAFGGSWDAFVRDWCMGGRLRRSPAEVAKSLTTLQRLWPDKVRSLCNGSVRGLSPTASIIELGLLLDACHLLDGFPSVFHRLINENEHRSAYSELVVVATLQRLGHPARFEPPLEGKVLDALCEVGEDQVYIEVVAPEQPEAAAAGGVNENSGSYKVILKRSKSHPLFGTQTAEMPRPGPLPPLQKPACKLTLAQAPVIRGLRLGMTSDELFATFPANEREEFDRAQKLKSAELPPNYGYTSFRFNLSDYATRDRFTGIGSLNFGILDGKVVYMSAEYRNAPQFDRPGQLMEIITKHYSLPELKDWPGENEYSTYPSLSCDGFRFQVHVHDAGSFSISLYDPTHKKITEERGQADRAKKREGFKL